MSLRFKLSQEKQMCSDLSCFIIMFFPRRRCRLTGWVCSWSVPGGPHGLDGVAVAFSRSVSISFSFTSPHLLCGISSLLIVLYLFQIRTSAVCSSNLSEIIRVPTSPSRPWGILWAEQFATIPRIALCAFSLKKGETLWMRKLSNLGLRSLEKTKRKRAQIRKLGGGRLGGSSEVGGCDQERELESGTGWCPISQSGAPWNTT